MLPSLASLVLGGRLTEASFATLVLRSCYVCLEFICGIALARIFGASSYGAYAFAVSCVTLLAIPAALGFDRLLVREVANFTALGEWSLLKGVLRRSTQIVLTTSVALAAVAACGILIFEPVTETTMSAALLAGISAVPLVAYARIRQAALQGLGRVPLAQLPETIVQPGLVLVLVLISHSYLTSMNATYLPVFLYVAATAVVCVFGAMLLFGSVPLAVRQVVPRYRTREWLQQAIPFVWMLSMNAIVTHVDTIALGVLRGPVDAGVYRIASQMAMLVAFPLTAVNMASAPAIAALYAKQDMRGIKQLARQAAMAILALSLPLVLILVAFGDALLGLFGSEFKEGYRALAILSTAYLVNAGAGTSGYLLIMTRHEKTAALGFTLAAILNIGGLVILVRIWGITGAAIATSASVVFVSIFFAVLAYRKLGIQATALPLPEPVRSQSS